jgi:hypothetical protein
MGKMRNIYRVLAKKPEGKTPNGRPRQKWNMLKWNLEKQDMSVWVDSSGSGYGPVAGSCEHGNELLGPIKGNDFLDLLCDYLLPPKRQHSVALL